MKLVSQIGTPIKTDRAMAMKDLLHYARIMVEISIEEDFHEVINFENEWGYICHVALKYKWKPIKCTKCGMFGHEEEECKKGQPRKAWRSKGPEIQGNESEQVPHRSGREHVAQSNRFEQSDDHESDEEMQDTGLGSGTMINVPNAGGGYSSGNNNQDIQNATGDGHIPNTNG